MNRRTCADYCNDILGAPSKSGRQQIEDNAAAILAHPTIKPNVVAQALSLHDDETNKGRNGCKGHSHIIMPFLGQVIALCRHEPPCLNGTIIESWDDGQTMPFGGPDNSVELPVEEVGTNI